MKEKKEKYDEIFKLLEKYKNDIEFNIKELKDIADKDLLKQELKEKYNIDLDINKGYITNTINYIVVNRYMSIIMFNNKTGYEIPYPDNIKQPENERLLMLKFSIGSIMFQSEDDDYPSEYFKKFWKELKTYKPKYIDSHNKGLYFSIDKAGDIYNNFNNILKKYLNLSKKEIAKRRLKKIKEEQLELERELEKWKKK